MFCASLPLSFCLSEVHTRPLAWSLLFAKLVGGGDDAPTAAATDGETSEMVRRKASTFVFIELQVQGVTVFSVTRLSTPTNLTIIYIKCWTLSLPPSPSLSSSSIARPRGIREYNCDLGVRIVAEGKRTKNRALQCARHENYKRKSVWMVIVLLIFAIVVGFVAVAVVGAIIVIIIIQMNNSKDDGCWTTLKGFSCFPLLLLLLLQFVVLSTSMNKLHLAHIDSKNRISNWIKSGRVLCKNFHSYCTLCTLCIWHTMADGKLQ